MLKGKVGRLIGGRSSKGKTTLSSRTARLLQPLEWEPPKELEGQFPLPEKRARSFSGGEKYEKCFLLKQSKTKKSSSKISLLIVHFQD